MVRSQVYGRFPDPPRLVDPSQQGFSASGRRFPTTEHPRRDWDALAHFSRRIMEEMAQTGKVTTQQRLQVGMRGAGDPPTARRRRTSREHGRTSANVNAAIGGTRVGKFKEAAGASTIRDACSAARERP